ncbi:MAG TPA: 30S ribosomal protein S9 [Phycisphaerae bacterium]|nr:30S ribosomal protein S9 [Phycisphaerae bacterium]HVX86161.1 30S ribosomal protein S9 [Phycisphaerae bacterium]
MADATTTTPATPTAAPSSRGKVVIGGKVFYWGTGRRKKSVARVRITAGEGKFSVNDREVEHYFQETKDRHLVRSPLIAANIAGNLDITVNVSGGGYSGQAGALVQGLGRALSLYDPSLRPGQKDGGFLTRDSRMKERKKYGQRGARRRFQFSKR